MQSEIIGLKEMFILASQFIAKFTEQSQFEVDTKRRPKFDNRFAVDSIDHDIWLSQSTQANTVVHSKAHVIVLPPSIESKYFINPETSLTQWLIQQQQP